MKNAGKIKSVKDNPDGQIISAKSQDSRLIFPKFRKVFIW